MGYPGMVVLALIPPLWRRIMDPRVVAHYGGDIRKAAVNPRQRALLSARYQTSNRHGEGLP